MDVIAGKAALSVDNETITSLAASRPTLRKYLKTIEEPVYQRQNQPHPKLGSFHE